MSRPISVVVPTIGRPDQLRRCLESLARCDPAPAEVVVVDQSETDEVALLVSEFGARGARLVPSTTRGIARAYNLGLESATCESVAITHDDCTVAEDWIGIAASLVAGDTGALYTGSVLPAGDPARIPSTIDDPIPRDYTGRALCRVLYPANMVCPKAGILAIGGFDQAFVAAAEDNDLCYRWLRGGKSLLYEPRLRVWHHDWRAPEQMLQVHIDYGRGQGIFYAKHLRRGDPRMLRFMAEDGWGMARQSAGALLRRRPERARPALGFLRGLPAGLHEGWDLFRRR